MLEQNLSYLAHPLRIQGNMAEVYLPRTRIGEICEIQKSLTESDVLGLAQVIGFNKDNTLLSLLNENKGFSRENVFAPTGKTFQIELHENLPGSIIDSMGAIKGRLDESVKFKQERHTISVETCGSPHDFMFRKPIVDPFITGVRAIDGLLTCGRGQRMGIFSAAGCGKTSLMNMITNNSDADIYVIGLIGERGREVSELVDQLKQSPRRSQIILVYATSDRACIERCNAAQISTTIAEFFCDQGKNVLLFIDSITRYARALRDVSLSMGELPARRGYPASVFEALPKLLERPGRFLNGTITAFYTVLIESEDESDVIGDEIRSILDGHIYLSRKLAEKGHYPAIDVMQSISRVFLQVTTNDHQELAYCFRDYLARQQEMQIFLDLGEYRNGDNLENDIALNKKSNMMSFLKQKMGEKINTHNFLEAMHASMA